MKIIGLTGSIGMGKSTTAAMFAAEGVPVYDADVEVHKLYAKGGDAVWKVGDRFPGVVTNGVVDRKLLSKRVMGDKAALKRLEEIVHPLLSATREAFFMKAAEKRAQLVVLDIPLLFETGGEARVDVIVVASAPADVQRARVLAREGMTREKFEAILARQIPDEEKRKRADFVIETGDGLDAAREQVRAVIRTLRESTAAGGEAGEA